MHIQIYGITGIPLLKEGDNLPQLILSTAQDQGVNIEDEDIIIIAETAIAKIEGLYIDLEKLKPSPKALELAKKTGKDPSLVEAIIQESKEIVKVGPDFIVSETKHGFICANAGIDESNVSIGKATPIPPDPDLSAQRIREEIEILTGKNVAVIISDTQGRPFREGAVGVAIGISGIDALWDRKGELDLYGRELQTTNIAVADELASAASIMMGQANEGIPVVIIRGVGYFKHVKSGSATIKQLIRPKEYDVFR